MDTNKKIIDVFMTTPLQSGMLYYDLMHPGSTIYMQQYSFTVTGDVHLPRFIYAWLTAFRTFPAICTSFHWEGLSKPLQVIHKRVRTPLVCQDLREYSAEEQKTHMEEFAEQDRQTGFTLDKPPLVRLSIFRLSDDSFQMMLTLHHIITDGWSLGLLFSEFCRVYNAKSQSTPVISRMAPSMKRYVEHLQTKDSAEARKWWQKYLKGAEATPLPRSSGQTPALGAKAVQREEIHFTVKETQELDEAAKGLGITMNILFQAAWAQTMAAKTGRSNVLFASCAASRPPEVNGIESVYGPLLDILPMRVDFEDIPVRQWLNSIFDTTLSAMSHGHLPLNELRKFSNDNGEGAFLNSMTVFENFSQGSGSELPFNITSLPGFERTSYPLTVLGYPEEALQLAIIYDAALFGEKDVQGLLAAMRDCMLCMVREPEESVRRLFVPSTHEGLSGLSILQGELHDSPSFDPWERFSHLAMDQGEQTALILEDERYASPHNVTYADLHKLSLAIAAALNERSFVSGSLAAVRLVPGLDAVASMLAVWRLGGAWVPLPLAYPGHLAESILEAAGVQVLLTKGEHLSGDGLTGTLPCSVVDLSALFPLEAQPPPFIGNAPDGKACVIYTSGSTGTPKGVSLSHRALGNRLQWMWDTFPWQKDERACAKTTMAFVDFVWELYGSLLAGVPVVIPNGETAVDTGRLFETVERHKVTRLILTPSVLASAQDMGLIKKHCQALSVLTSSGEPLPPELAEKITLDAPQLRLLNLYGSTEVMGDATWYEFSPKTDKSEWHPNVPIGHLITNTRLAVIDENGIPVPFEEEGELYISGDCLADGYHKDKFRTSDAFMPLPATGGSHLWFKTGDMASMNDNGLVFCMGRKDRQLKIRGVRVGPREVAACLKEHSSVKDATVCAVEDNNGKKRLTAYIIPNPGTGESSSSSNEGHNQNHLAEQLEAHAEGRLMSPKRPEAYVFIAEWPTTVSNKIDQKQLPNPYTATSLRPADHPPQGETENSLADIWKRLLGVQHINRKDDFFQLGGDSLSVTQLAFELRKSFSRYIPFQHLYQVPRLKDMAAYLDEPETTEQDAENPFFLSMPPDEMIQEDVHAADAFAPQDQTVSLPLEEGMCVLLTGVPGFISLWLLAKLLESGKYSVVCLKEHDFVEPVSPLESLCNRLVAAGCWEAGFENRLSVALGRLGQERFGMSEAEWSNLADSVDIVFHCGLHVNLAQSYEHLRPINIGGTKEVIRFCCQGKTKPLHYISSHAIIDNSARTDSLTPVPEDSELTSYKGLPGGYLLSRWSMERMIWLARQRGLPSAIYRYVPVGGDSVTYQCETTEMYWRLLRLFCRTRVIPNSNRPINIISVDTAATLVLAIAGDPLCYGHAFHICNPRSEPWSAWADYLQKLGYPISVISDEEWFRYVTSMPEEALDENSRILLSFLSKTGKASLQHLPYAMENTGWMMEKHGLNVPPFSFDLFKEYWCVMHNNGWLPGPSENKSAVSS